MKTTKKHSRAEVNSSHDRATLPTQRQKSLDKLYRTLQIGGGIVLVLAIALAIAMYWDRLLPSGKLRMAAAKEREMRQPKLNPNTPPGPAPEGMVWVPGGEFYMGDENFEDAADVHLVYVDGFWMDRYEVTNEQYAKFVTATKYVTVAQKQPDRKDFPDARPEDLKPFSIIFKQPGPTDRVNLRTHEGWWDLKYGATWEHPEGPDSNIKGREKHPVVHICYTDAVAYCKWAARRLPTEAEWEFAARGGLDRKAYAWGDKLKPDGKWMANIWQGNFPYHNTREDGFEGVAPVGSFPANGYGLHDMSGNVWEWCADWYRANYYGDSPEKNPPGPDTGYDRLEPNTPKRVQRGGSFLCADNYCVRYMVGTRGKGEVSSSANHIGFRCARSAK